MLHRLRTMLLMLALFMLNVVHAEGLLVEDAGDVAFAIADLTRAAENIGLTRTGLAAAVTARLRNAGLQAHPTDAQRDEEVLFVDVVVEGDTYYAAASFWRVAIYQQPGGESSSGFVNVWQDFSVGTHRGDADMVNVTVTAIVDRFVARYCRVNGVGKPERVAATQ